MWDDCDPQAGKGIAVEPDWGLAEQAAPDFEFYQRISCWRSKAAGLTRYGLYAETI